MRSHLPQRSGARFDQRLRNRVRPDSDQLMLKQSTHRFHQMWTANRFPVLLVTEQQPDFTEYIQNKLVMNLRGQM